MHRPPFVSDAAHAFARDQIELSVRASNIVQVLDVKTLAEFMGLTQATVMSAKNAGIKTWHEIAQVQHNISPSGAAAEHVSNAAGLVRLLNDEMNELSAFSDDYYLTLDATGCVSLIKRIA